MDQDTPSREQSPVLIYEHLCATGAAGGLEGLMPEGRAMLTALVDDLGRCGVRAVGMWADASGSMPEGNARWLRVREPDDIPCLLESACVGGWSIYIIAPETDDLLAGLVETVVSLRGRSLNATPAAIRWCADKWRLHERWQQAAIPTIPTWLLSEWLRSAPPIEGPEACWVVKRRDGAGGDGTRVFSHPEGVDRFRAGMSTSDADCWIVQPFVEGLPTSVAVLIDEAGTVTTWPAAGQTLTISETVSYHGGSLSVGLLTDKQQQALQALARRAVEVVPGLRGYVGVDLLWTVAGPVAVEINPRLCSSYNGYRALLGPRAGLAAIGETLADFEKPPLGREALVWDAAGQIRQTILGEDHDHESR